MDLGDRNLTPIRVLGQGSFGRVILCKERRLDKYRQVCVKRIIVQNPKAEMNMIKEEVYIISQLKHPRIIRFVRSFVHHGSINIVMEYAPNGTVRSLLDYYQRSGIPADNLLQIFCDILMGLEYLHIRNVIHRDIKPENLLLDKNNRVQIADFGISAVHTPCKQYMNTLGTPYYMAPEIMAGNKFDFKSDIWSLGCVLYEMCTGFTPFGQAQSLKDLRYVVRILTKPKIDCQSIGRRYGPIWMNLCEKIIVYDPQNRISLPKIVTFNPLITIPYYSQYFAYNY